MPGCACRKAPSRGASQLEAIAWSELNVSTPPSASSRTSAKAARIASSASLTAGASRLPASVSTTWRGVRRNSGVPARSSSTLT